MIDAAVVPFEIAILGGKAVAKPIPCYVMAVGRRSEYVAGWLEATLQGPPMTSLVDARIAFHNMLVEMADTILDGRQLSLNVPNREKLTKLILYYVFGVSESFWELIPKNTLPPREPPPTAL